MVETNLAEPRQEATTKSESSWPHWTSTNSSPVTRFCSFAMSAFVMIEA